ncbi:type I phosphomannose isomerase catalytic subunit [Petrotoga sp. 9PWA.NaAc.5.4]|uniref:type I phosphomannose isomerase catalytic subunit n=1 Tax=Petrotoga sp. 9PWA.NaAc.5.4 TaxID=1434328 RepID=UPI000CB0DFFA|nr:type I phosphomannose isomerase catalytic subunit [Petrotoga sp. 9PWA.NaAc.5.4]PNR95330.1 mannose-6-phosphate isomerase [Petrotoga sp. 9PWA.NaAc.5.4]
MKIKEPLISQPIFSEKIWGNRDINNLFNIDSKDPIGEVWLFSSLKNSETILFGKESKREYGKVSQIFRDFPLLLKLIGTSSWLSIQLHPDNEMAKKIEDQPWGKSEAWFFLKDGGQIKVSNNNEEILKAMKDNTWDNVLETYHMDKFDSIFIPAGTVHTLGPNSFLLEIQQSSDLTYRLYDWGRPREIHVEKSREVLENVKATYCLSRKINGMHTVYFSFQKFSNELKKGLGLFVNLKNYETIVLAQDVEYYFEGEFIEFRLNEKGWKPMINKNN